MATTADAEVVLRLYELRGEQSLRAARRFMVFEFQPKTLEELRAVSRDVKAKENVFWRQAISYWEMAAAMVLRGAVDPDLYLDTAGEGILIYAKFHHFHIESEKESGSPFMRHTAAMIAKYPPAQAIHQAFLTRFGVAKTAS